MANITVQLPNGDARTVPAGTTALDIAQEIGSGLARASIAARIDGVVTDVTTPLEQDVSVQLITFNDPEGQEVFWHSSAHLLAQAVQNLYPDAKPTIGPPIENGFYYDFANLPIGSDDLEKIEKEMLRLAKEDYAVSRIDYTEKKQAQDAFKDNKFKLEIIEQTEEGLSAYQQGDFIDLCRGPHIPKTGMIKAVWLHKMSGAYWRADAKNEQLTRIYGITFPDKKALRSYKQQLEEAKKRDHRVLGRKLDLYGFEPVSPGSPFFYPNGTIVYNELLNFLRNEYVERGYQEVITPLVYDKSLWEQSGHWEYYRENMFLIQDGEQIYSLKPMNCPSHCLIYNRKQHSYRDMPVRISDFAALHRNELSGTLGGLTRVRKMSQDDAHIFCRPDQIKQEIAALVDFANFIYISVMKMEFDHVELSTRPEKFLGEKETWDEAETALQEALEEAGMDYVINEGDGAFYGPKIDFHIKDALGRTWQTATIQLDFQLPQRFNCTYLDMDSRKQHVVMIHRALLGSIERFMGVLMEHYAGKLPLWLSPQHARILPITRDHVTAAREAALQLTQAGLRVHVDDRSETLGKKVREAQVEYVPYILVIGDREMEDGTVTVRTRENEIQGAEKISDFTTRVLNEIADKK